MTRAPTTLRGVSFENNVLVSDIDRAAGAGTSLEDDASASTESLVLRVYDNIQAMKALARRGPSQSQQQALAVWEGFLIPIAGLKRMQPHGVFVAARMLLYLMAAFQKNCHLNRNMPSRSSRAFDRKVAEQTAFLFRADEALLDCLRALWILSSEGEDFTWVFCDYGVAAERKTRECRAARQRGFAAALSPKDLAHRGGLRPQTLDVQVEPAYVRFGNSRPGLEVSTGVFRVWEPHRTDTPIRGKCRPRCPGVWRVLIGSFVLLSLLHIQSTERSDRSSPPVRSFSSPAPSLLSVRRRRSKSGEVEEPRNRIAPGRLCSWPEASARIDEPCISVFGRARQGSVPLSFSVRPDKGVCPLPDSEGCVSALPDRNAYNGSIHGRADVGRNLS